MFGIGIIRLFQGKTVLSKGQLIDLRIDTAAYQGWGVARLDKMVVFVKHAVPGDQVRARIIKKKKNHAEAVIEELTQVSAFRVDPRCQYFGVCGGCSWQNTEYQKQLAFKREQVEEILCHLAGLDGIKVCPTLPSPDTYHYRNKMEFTFGAQRWLTEEEIASGKEFRKGFALGLHIPKRWDRILDLEVCYLQSPLSVEIVNRVRKVALSKQWSPYDGRAHTGYLRNLVIRTGAATGEMMVNLVTSRSEPRRMACLKEALLEAFSQVTTIVNTINPERSPVAQGAEEITYYGKGIITDRIAELVFIITPDTFFQPNTAQAEQLCHVVRDFAKVSGAETVYDLYAGSGSFALFVSSAARNVVGVENQKRAVETAELNVEANRIDNCLFHCCDVAEALSETFIRRNGRPQVIISDPPRAGMHKRVCQAIVQLAPDRVVYVSCNPATQARDLKILSQIYEIEAVQPVDMFPHTYHIENVVALRRR